MIVFILVFHGNSRTLKWRYCTIFLALFCRPYLSILRQQKCFFASRFAIFGPPCSGLGPGLGPRHGDDCWWFGSFSSLHPLCPSCPWALEVARLSTSGCFLWIYLIVYDQGLKQGMILFVNVTFNILPASEWSWENPGNAGDMARRACRARVVMSAGTSVEDQSLKQRILEYLKATGDWVPLFTIVKVSKKWDATTKKKDAGWWVYTFNSGVSVGLGPLGSGMIEKNTKTLAALPHIPHRTEMEKSCWSPCFFSQGIWNVLGRFQDWPAIFWKGGPFRRS